MSPLCGIEIGYSMRNFTHALFIGLGLELAFPIDIGFEFASDEQLCFELNTRNPYSFVLTA